MSLGAGLISFLSHSLLIVQWVAGVFAIFAALASIASVLRHWDKGR